MRIITGQARGVALRLPPPSKTRPTAARTREAMFNLLRHGVCARNLDGARVADIFAGTGALGLEALSRGAAHATFLENDPAVCRVLRANIDACRMGDRARVLRLDGRAPPRADAPFDILFLDPPYDGGMAEKALHALPRGGWIAPGGLAVTQSHPKEQISPPPELHCLEDRRYGLARLMFWEYSA